MRASLSPVGKLPRTPPARQGSRLGPGLVLDDESREAARQLARRYGCSVSEAMRRALVRQRDAVVGVPAAKRRERVRALRRLFDLFEGNDAAAEVRRLKEEDQGF